MNIRDTLQCVELAVLNPARQGEYRVFNQFTEVFSVNQLAALVVGEGQKLGLRAEVTHTQNPRQELEEHHYGPAHAKLLALGLQPHFLSDVQLKTMLARIEKVKHRIKREIILPHIKWNGKTQEIEELKLMWAGG